MEDDKTTTEELPVSEEKPQAPEEKFLLKNATRGRTNRTLRAQQPVHHRLKQYVAGGKYRVIRGRPVVLRRSEVETHFKELKEKIASGVFELCTLDNRPVDIETLKATKEIGPSAPLPNPPLDSIANDKQNVGERVPMFPGGDVEGTEGVMPELVAKAEVEEGEEALPEGAIMTMQEGDLGVEEEVPALIGGGDPSPVVEGAEPPVETAPEQAPALVTEPMPAPVPEEPKKSGKKEKNK